MSEGPWRQPAEESADLFPGLVVHDGRVSGSITFGPTRLPIWSPVASFDNLRDFYLDADDPQISLDAEAGESLLFYLRGMRGEFARLLLVMADAERRGEERCGAVLDEHAGPDGGIVNVSPWDPDAVQLPAPWWDDPELSAPVVDQLRRCLAVLT